MDRLFYPKSVAVIGASENPRNLARIIVENLFEFQFHGEILLVGKSGGILYGRRILPSVEDLPPGVDVAVILTPSATVPAILDACGRRKIPWAVVETAGFREFSEGGAELEREVLAIARKWGIRLVGPNCIGVINVENGFVVPFTTLKAEGVRKGKVSVLAQSGGVAVTYFNLLTSANLGMAKIVSMGNKLDLNEIDYLRYLVTDPRTEIIGLYVESLGRGRELMEIARSTNKFIILHKSNTGESSRQIARLHTAALAGDDRVVEAALRQAGIVRTRDFRSFANAVKVFSLPAMKGKNLVILSRFGGIAIVSADSAERYGFRLLPLSPKFRAKIRGYFRAKVIEPTNPIDLGDLFEFDLYTKILDQVLRLRGVDGVLFQHGAAGEEKIPSRRLVQAVKELSFRHQKPVALCYLTEEEELATIKKTTDYPIFSEPEDALSALAIARDHYRRQTTACEVPVGIPVDAAAVKRILRKARRERRDPLLPEALDLIKAYGIPVADYRMIRRRREVAGAMKAVGGPVALKIISGEISHKSEAGGVILDVGDPAAAETGYDRLKGLAPDRDSSVLLQKMVKAGKEVILGAKRDPSFGPVLLFGLGGIYVEVLKDTSLRVAPICPAEAEEMIAEIRGANLLAGVRGEPALDRAALVDLLLRLSQLVTDFPEIEGIDINPVRVLEKGAVALDCRVQLAAKEVLR